MKDRGQTGSKNKSSISETKKMVIVHEYQNQININTKLMQRCDACMQMGSGFSFPKGSNQGEFHVWTRCEYFRGDVSPSHTLLYSVLTLCLRSTWGGWRCQVFHPSANLLHHTSVRRVVDVAAAAPWPAFAILTRAD